MYVILKYYMESCYAHVVKVGDNKTELMLDAILRNQNSISARYNVITLEEAENNSSIVFDVDFKR